MYMFSGCAADKSGLSFDYGSKSETAVDYSDITETMEDDTEDKKIRDFMSTVNLPRSG